MNFVQVRKKLPFFLFIFFFCAHSISCLATHIFGGELLYSNVSGKKYVITLTLYGDCAASSTIFNSLYTATPFITALRGGALVDSFRLQPRVVGIEVSPVCPAQLGNTSCNGGTLPGVKKFVYSDTITLPDTAADWQFIFSGDMGAGYTAGRSTNITNIYPGTNIQLEADLNNLAGPNSSPTYSTLPTPFYCVNVLEQYNQGAIDPNGDSLAFTLVPGVDGISRANVAYVFPYSEIDPIATDSAGFGFNSLNGQVTFTPSKTQDGLVDCQVSEYRGGVLVGTSEREMTFVVLNNCTGTPPNLAVSNVTGGKITSTSASGKNVINLCVGTPALSFDLTMSNPDGDTTVITDQALPGTSTLLISDNGTPNPSITFNWSTATVPAGIYTFYVTIKNDHCPISNTQTIGYTINITPIPDLSDTMLYPNQCVHQALMQYNLSGGYLPRTVTILQYGNPIKSLTDTSGTIRDSLPAGIYTAIASSDPQCTTLPINIVISDSGTLPVLPLTVIYCKGDSMQPIYFPLAGDSAIVYWFDAKNDLLAAPPIPNTNVVDTTTYFVTEQYKKCASSNNRVTAIVYPLPVASVINIPKTVCYGDTVYLEASGGTQYTWSPKKDVFTNMFGQLCTVLFASETFTVNVADQHGCTDSTSVNFSDIQQCCNFGYPNAFTPNGDGRNDGFRIVTYGNMASYRLSIYNRFGQLVFDSANPREYWDGKFLGVPCDMGTYFYQFKGTCLTGRTETYKGDVTLIR
jgi:gliding motility-associated-like protein